MAAEPELELAGVPAEVGEQRMADALLALVARTQRQRVQGFAAGQAASPEGRRWMGQPEMDVPVHGQRGEHLPMVGVEPGDAEHRQPFGQAGPAGIGAQRRGHRLNQFGRMRTAEFGREPAPQLGLPGPVRQGAVAQRRRRRGPRPRR